MKKIRTLVAVAALPLSAAAYAMPAAVPEIYYDNLPHRWQVLTNSPGFCETPIGAQSLVCWAKGV